MQDQTIRIGLILLRWHVDKTLGSSKYAKLTHEYRYLPPDLVIACLANIYAECQRQTRRNMTNKTCRTG